LPGDSFELEAGASVLQSRDGLELPVDLLIKKPFPLLPRLDFMIGAGSELVEMLRPGQAARFGGQLALDLMYWPTERVGVWLEPTCDALSYRGVSLSLESTSGLLIGW
jgi:hypothetical protein